MRLSTLRIEDDKDIVRLRNVGEEAVAGAGFQGFAATRIITALLELGRNLIDHASGGRMTLFLSRRGSLLDLVIEAVDQGPGFRNVEGSGAIASETVGALGLGLQGVRRMADRFEVNSGSEGSRITAAFHTALDPERQTEYVESILSRMERLDRDDPSATLARQNRDLLDALEQRDMLMAEVHHRTKNNLSLVMGLMRLSRNTASTDETRDVLRDLEGRVAAIAKVHDQLQHSSASNTVELVALLRDVAERSRSAFASPGLQIAIEVEGEPLRVASSAAVDLSLVAGELITNACKHAFEGRESGRITMICRREGDEVRLTVADDGVGLPEGVTRPERSESLGWQMVRSMVNKHSGTLSTDSGEGLTVRMSFSGEFLMSVHDEDATV